MACALLCFAFLCSLFSPRRIDCALAALPAFITDYFSQNPISLLAILETRQSRCTHISDLGSSKQRQLDALRQRAGRQRLDDKEPRGEVRNIEWPPCRTDNYNCISCFVW